MLIYATHNFSENYLSAIGASDDFMKSEILIDEIGKLIVENKRDVVDLLRKNSVNASINDNNQKLAYVFAKYIGSDRKIRLEVVEMIKSKSVDTDKLVTFIGHEVYHSSDGKKSEFSAKETKQRIKERTGKFIENIKAVISDKDKVGTFTASIADTLEKTFTDKKSEKQRSSPLEMNARILQERVKMNELTLSADSSGSVWSTKKILLWSAGIITIISVGLYIAYRIYTKKQAEASASAASTPPAPVAQPVPTQATT